MHKLLETIKEAKAFSEIYPELKIWKKSLESHCVFVGFDEMSAFAGEYLEGEKSEAFINATVLIELWREETQKQFKVDFANYDQKFQVDFAFPFGPPLEHIVEAENRMFAACLIQALKGLNEQKLYQEFEHYKKAHERHWTIGPLTQTFAWAVCPNDRLQLSGELKTKQIGALSFL
jgi:hypothetical protein